jgi:hypothetical protein
MQIRKNWDFDIPTLRKKISDFFLNAGNVEKKIQIKKMGFILKSEHGIWIKLRFSILILKKKNLNLFFIWDFDILALNKNFFF